MRTFNGVNNTQTDNTDYMLNVLTEAFSGRGLALNAKNRASQYQDMPNDVVYSGYGAYNNYGRESLTVEQFESAYRRRTSFTPVAARVAAAGASQAKVNQPRQAAKAPRAAVKPTTQKAVAQKPPRNERAEKPVERRAVQLMAKNKISILGDSSPTKTFRRLPITTLLTVVACAVSLMFIIGSSVMMTEASNEYNDIQSEVRALEIEKEKLSTELEMKNDLRVIEDIAKNELGMVKKNLITRQYIKLNDTDVVEAYADEENNIGISTILSAIRGE